MRLLLRLQVVQCGLEMIICKSLYISLYLLICIAAESPKKRKVRHRPNKFESAVQSFRNVLTGQHEENLRLTTSIQQQWLELEKQQIDAEMERERKQKHEIQMMQLFSTMVHTNAMQVPQRQVSAPPASQHILI